MDENAWTNKSGGLSHRRGFMNQYNRTAMMAVFLWVFLWLYDFSWGIFYHISPPNNCDVLYFVVKFAILLGALPWLWYNVSQFTRKTGGSNIMTRRSVAVMAVGAILAAVSFAGRAAENAAPADELSRSGKDASAAVPVAPEGYRRPRGW